MSPAPPHGRRNLSSLRRPPQEVAASLNHDGGRNPTRSGATVGESRPSSHNQAPFPSGEGVTAAAVTDRENPACSASRRAQRKGSKTPRRDPLKPGSPSASRALQPCNNPPRMRVQRAEGSLARVWGEEPQRLPAHTRIQYDRRRATQLRAGCGHCPPRSPSVSSIRPKGASHEHPHRRYRQ